MIKLFHMDNMDFDLESATDKMASLIYADHIFEEMDFSWVDKYWTYLKDDGIFAVHTDHKLMADLTIKLRSLDGSMWVNDIVTVQEWGGRPKNKFPQKTDFILVYAKGKSWRWDASKIQVPKQMVNKGFNPSGRTTKTPNNCWYDLGNFSTTSGERVKTSDGKNISWQKPLKQLRRLMTPFLQKGDLVIDPFAGSGTSGEVAHEIGCDYIGIEYDIRIFNLALNRLNNLTDGNDVEPHFQEQDSVYGAVSEFYGSYGDYPFTWNVLNRWLSYNKKGMTFSQLEDSVWITQVSESGRSLAFSGKFLRELERGKKGLTK